MNELNPQQSHCYQEVQLEYGNKSFSKIKNKKKMKEYGESYIINKKSQTSTPMVKPEKIL